MATQITLPKDAEGREIPLNTTALAMMADIVARARELGGAE